jgi:hypothetical protein
LEGRHEEVEQRHRCSRIPWLRKNHPGRNHMRTIGKLILATCILTAGGAMAQDAARRTEEIRQNSEAMKPQMNAPERATSSPMAAPVSEADRKAEEARMRSEAMKPETSAPASTARPATDPVSEADRKAAEARTRSEMMKPQ